MMRKLIILAIAIFLLLSAGCEKKPPTTVGPTPSGPDTGDGGGANDTGTVTQPAPAAPPTGKDLYVDRVMWSTVNPEINTQTELKITVINQGTEAVDGFDYNIRITKDGTEWKDETKTYAGTLYPGNKTRIELLYTFETEGKYRAEVYVDKDNKLSEKNRFNNVGLSPEARAMKPTSTPTGDDDDETDDSGTSGTGTGSCSDTDSGKDKYTKGECDDGTVLGIGDYCNAASTSVIEYYCDTDGKCKTETMACDDYCESGACV